MALHSLLGEVATEATQNQMMEQTLLVMLAILEKLPRVDNSDQMMVNIGSGTVTTVSAVTTLDRMGGRDISAAPFALANAGTSHIYDNIKVS